MTIEPKELLLSAFERLAELPPEERAFFMTLVERKTCAVEGRLKMGD